MHKHPTGPYAFQRAPVAPLPHHTFLSPPIRPPAPRSLLLDGLPALSGLSGLRVLKVELSFATVGEERMLSPADALATLARSHPALEKVRLAGVGGAG